MKNKENESVGYLFYLQKSMLLKITCDHVLWVNCGVHDSGVCSTALHEKAFDSLGVYCVLGTGQVCWYDVDILFPLILTIVPKTVILLPPTEAQKRWIIQSWLVSGGALNRSPWCSGLDLSTPYWGPNVCQAVLESLFSLNHIFLNKGVISYFPIKKLRPREVKPLLKSWKLVTRIERW